MSSLARSATVLALIFAAQTRVAAQGVPNLTGTWTLAADKSDFGPMPAPTSRTDVIDHREPAITIKRTILNSGSAAAASFDLKYAVDGKPHTNTTPQGEVTSTLKWDGAVLVITSQVPTPAGTAEVTDRLSLSADGKTLTFDRTILVQGQELKQNVVMVKP